MRIVVLGCGTGVGKTRVSVAILRALASRGLQALGLKPIESGISREQGELAPPAGSDAAALSAAGSIQTQILHPLFALPDPVSPHLAARSQGFELKLEGVSAWVKEAEANVAPHVLPHSAHPTLVETAGGVFSPLGVGLTNFDLAQQLEPAIWVLVAADALGVLHDVTSTLKAMRASGREPDHVVLSGAREPDASTGSNAAELATLGIVTPSAVLARNDDSGVHALIDRILEQRSIGHR